MSPTAVKNLEALQKFRFERVLNEGTHISYIYACMARELTVYRSRRAQLDTPWDVPRRRGEWRQLPGDRARREDLAPCSARRRACFAFRSECAAHGDDRYRTPS